MSSFEELLRVLEPGALVVVTEEPTDQIESESRVAPSTFEAPTEFPMMQLPSGALLAGQDAIAAALLSKGQDQASGTIVLIPPWGRLDGRREDAALVALENFLRARPSSEDVIAVIPASLLLSRWRQFWAALPPGNAVSQVVRVESLFEEFHRSLQVCLIRFTAATTQTLFAAGEAQHVIDSLATSRRGKADGVSFVVSPAPNPADGLEPERHDPRRLARVADLSNIGQTVPLGTLAEIRRGRLHPGVDQLRDQPTLGAIPVLAGRMVRHSGLALDEVTLWATEVKEEELCRAGDLILRGIQHLMGDTVGSVAEVFQDDLPLALGHTVVAIRPRDDLDQLDRIFLRHFLASARLRDQLVGVGMQLSPSLLAEVAVPVMDGDLRLALQSVETAIQELSSYSALGQGLIEELLGDENLTSGRTRLLERSNLLRQRAAAARSLDDLNYRVATRYPLPVAFRWRTAMAARGGPHELTQILHAHEVMHAYLAIIALVVARNLDTEVGHTKDMRQRLRRGQGVTLGDWTNILRNVAEAKTFTRAAETEPFIEVTDFLSRDSTREASSRLTAIRNDVSHLRQFGPTEATKVVASARDQLETLYEAADFLMEYPLVRVLKTNWDSFEHTNTIEYLALNGDHAAVPRSTLVSDSSEIEADSLYLLDRHGKLHLLNPLLIGRDCPECGHWSTFHPDRPAKNDESMFEYKSLEHGHPVALPIADRLVSAGILGERNG